MNNFRFTLEKYKNPSSRHTCPNCGEKRSFSRYVDTQNEMQFSDSVGRCNREDKCGYHYPPKAYFADNPDNCSSSDYRPSLPHKQMQRPTPSYLSYSLVEESLSNYSNNNLYQYVKSIFGYKLTNYLFEKYRIGTSDHWQGATIFWQIDQQQKVRTGKVMLYDQSNGRRKKQPINYINWVHSLLKIENYNLDQCFFGEHLISKTEDLPIGIVESEKSAMVAACYIPQFIWIATGGKHGCFTVDHLQILRGHKVVLFPDLGAIELWEQKAEMMKQAAGIDVHIFDYLEKNAPEEEKKEGYDIADYLLQQPPQKAIYEVWIENNPLLKMLVEDMDLIEE